MQIAVLGPLEVRDGDRVVEIAGGRLQSLLISLANQVPRAVPAQSLVESVWGDDPPADEVNALQSLVSRLRRTLGDGDLVQQSAGGYRLAVAAEDVDRHRFARLVAAGRDALRGGDAVRARDQLRGALALWRGDASDAALSELYLDARADLLRARLLLGEAAELVAELEGLTTTYPLRERFAGLLLQALAGSGRTAEALAAYEKIRERLAERLGADPSPTLQSIHLELLRAKPAPTARRDNLRATLTSFVGREEQLARIGSLLAGSRLVTLAGPGGAGKTRLAVEAAARLTGQFTDGVWLAELAPVTDPVDVPQAVLGALGLGEATLLDRPVALAQLDAMSRLVDSLAERSALLVLDNCEHLLDAAAHLADQLLARCPGLRIVATSREPLGIFGECLLVVPPLLQPTENITPAQALDFPAVRLFADRAASVQPGFEIDAGSVAAVVEIVRRLDGLPLAIELAAARLRSLPVEQIALRLSDRFRLLTGGSRTAMPRHRTLRAVVEWSWDLLADDERLLAERLAVFSGGISPAAAAALCPADDLDDLLAALVDKSLLQPLAAGAGLVRYRMLETIREFGLDRLAGRGEVAAARLAHASHFAALVHRAAPALRGPEQASWLDVLGLERDNVLAGLKYLGDDGRAQEAIDVVNDLGWYWMSMGRHAEATIWASFVLAVPGALRCRSAVLAEAFLAINSMAWDSPDPDAIAPDAEPIEHRRQALVEINRRLAEDDEDTHPMMALLRPVIAMFADDDSRVDALVERALGSPDPWIAAMVRTFRALVAENHGDVHGMREDAEISLAQFRVLGERWGQANSLQVLAQVDLMDGRLTEAARAYREALRLIGELGADQDEAMLRLRLTDVLMRMGDEAAAREQVVYVQTMAQNGRSGAMEAAISLLIMADIARLAGDLDEAGRLCEECVARLARMPSAHPARGHGRALLSAVSAKLDLELGDVAAARAHLADSYRIALTTRDMPVVAATGVAVSRLAREVGRYADAAQILGAAARLRGSEDPTQPDIARQLRDLRRLSPTFDQDYAAGRELSGDAARARLDPGRLD